MNDLTKQPPPRAVEPYRPPRQCAYCGAPLVPGFYFCLACATPYQSVEAILPVPKPELLTAGMLVEKKAPHVAPLFWTYMAVVVGSAVAGFFLFGRNDDLTLLLGSAAMLVTTCVFASLHWPSLAVQFRRIGFLHPAAYIALLALGPLLLVNYGFHSWVVRQLGEHYVRHHDLNTALGEGGMILFFCIFPAVLEEIAFRGLVQHWLQVALRPMLALVLASALFTVLHFSIVSAPYLFAVGMLLGWAKWKTGSLYPSMLIHFLHNFVVLEIFPK